MSISIIGGADGPTSIFIASSNSLYDIVAIALVTIALIGIIIWAIRKRKH